MRKFAFLLFLILFICAVTIPAFSGPTNGRGKCAGLTFGVNARNQITILGGKSEHAWCGLAVAVSRDSAVFIRDNTGKVPDDPTTGKQVVFIKTAK